MERIETVLRGIERMLPPGEGADGGMYELLNIDTGGGVLRPGVSLQATGLCVDEGERIVYVHRGVGYVRYIVYDTNSGYVYAIDEEGERSEVLHLGDAVLQSVTSIDNMLTVLTDKGMRHLLYDVASKSYNEIKDVGLPNIGIIQKWYEKNGDEETGEVKDVALTVSSEKMDIIPDIDTLQWGFIFGESYPNELGNKYMITQMSDTFAGLLSNMRVLAANNNKLVDGYLVRYGLRLYDGSYKYVSPPIYLRGKEYSMLTETAYYSRAEQDMCWKSFNACCVKGEAYRILIDVSDTEVGSEWDNNIVVSLDVFLSQPIPMYDSDRKINAVLGAKQTGEIDEGYTYVCKIEWGSTIEPRTENIENYSNYYRVARLGREDIEAAQASGEAIELDLREKIEHILYQPELEMNFTPHTVISTAEKVYNNRLHLLGIKEILYSDIHLRNMLYRQLTTEGESGYAFYEWIIAVTLQHNGMTHGVCITGDNATSGQLSSYISYPDARATKLVIAVKTGGLDGTEYYSREFLLKSHPMADEAYHFDGFDTYGLSLIHEDYAIDEEAYYRTKDVVLQNYIERPNVMRVSRLNNAMIYEYDKTYEIGERPIIAAEVAVETMSEGQYGEYPLYVFTEGGIYLMQQGSGDVLYSRVSPLSLSVATSRDMIVPVANGVLYGSEAGLYLLQGSNMTDIGATIDDRDVIDNRNSAMSLWSIVQAMTGHNIDTKKYDSLLRQGKLAYSYKRGEVYLYVPGEEYVYVYSLRSGMWSRNRWQVSYSVNDYPDVLMIDNTGTAYEIPTISDEHTVAEEVLLVTRPMNMNDFVYYKSLLQMNIMSYLSGNNAPVWLHIGILCSNDGAVYKKIWERKLSSGSVRNLRLSHPGGSWRYYVLVVHGKGMSADSYIRSLLSDVERKGYGL